MSAPELFLSDLTPEEAGAGFSVRRVGHPDGLPTTVSAAVYTWGDPSHRLVKTRWRDGIVFQLQAFGRRRAGAGMGPFGWYAERYWPGRYGTDWVLARLREYVGRPGYRPLIDIQVPPVDVVAPAPAAPAVLVAATH
jgi:hypothetical protein